MKRLLAGFLLSLFSLPALAAPASRSAMQNEINNNLPTNGQHLISATAARTTLLDMLAGTILFNADQNVIINSMLAQVPGLTVKGNLAAIPGNLTDIPLATFFAQTPASSIPMSSVTGLTTGTNGQLLIGQTGSNPTWNTMSGDCTLSISGNIICTKTNGTAFGNLATANAGTGLSLAANSLSCVSFSSSALGCVPASGGGTSNFLRADGTWNVPSCAIFTSGAAGCVPASGGGTTNFLRADGTWAAPTAPTLTYSTTRALISTTHFPSGLNSFISQGYATLGDYGAGCKYIKSQSSGGIGAIADADGNYWTLPANEPLNITCFGAKVNGSTDDTAAIQATINAVQTNFGQGRIIYPMGTVKQGQVSITSSNITIQGQGYGTVIVPNSATTDIFDANYGSGQGSNVNVFDLSIVSAGTQSGGSFVNFVSCIQCETARIYTYGAFIAISSTGPNNVMHRMHDLYLFHSINVAINIGGGGDQHVHNTLVDNPAGSQPADGIYVTSSGGFWITDVDVVRSGNGLCLCPTSSATVEWGFLENAAFDTGSGWGILISPSTATVLGIHGTNTWTSTNTAGGLAVTVAGGGAVSGVTLLGHRSINNGGAGISINGSSAINWIKVGWCSLIGNSNPGAGGTANTNYGIVVFNGTAHFDISHCNFSGDGQTNYQLNALEIQGPTNDYYTVYFNDTTGGFSSTGVFDGGTGTHKNVGGNF